MMTKYKTLSVTLMLAALLQPAAHANFAVSFDASTVTAPSSLIAEDFALNTITPTITSAGNPDYSGPDIYGAMDEDTAATWSVTTAGNTGLRLRMEAGVGNNMTGLFLFQTDSVSFDAANDTLSATTFFANPLELDVRQVRFVVEDAGAFYISGTSSPITNPDTITSEALSVSWFSYDPTTVSGIGAIGGAAAPTFQDIDFIGVQLFGSRVDGDPDPLAVNFGVTNFTATAVPEPSSFALLFGVMVGLTAARRRSKA